MRKTENNLYPKKCEKNLYKTSNAYNAPLHHHFVWLPIKIRENNYHKNILQYS